MSYSLVGDRVVRDDGYVAVAHRNSNGATYSASSTVYYVFTPSHNVSMAWIAPEHVAGALSEMARVCCGKSGKKYILAGIVNVHLWTTGDRHGKQ